MVEICHLQQRHFLPWLFSFSISSSRVRTASSEFFNQLERFFNIPKVLIKRASVGIQGEDIEGEDAKTTFACPAFGPLHEGTGHPRALGLLADRHIGKIALLGADYFDKLDAT